MLRIILTGCHGRMGTQISQYCKRHTGIKIVAGIDCAGRVSDDYPVFPSPDLCNIGADVLIDFSHPDALHQLLPYCIHRRLPALLGVTGYSQQQLNEIKNAYSIIPIFRAANLSIGANLLLKLTRSAAETLSHGFDIDIIERHHREKRDSPSGTALLLSLTTHKEVPIKSIRSGSTAGEHTVIFAGPDEVLELSHRADSRDVYASGAIRAAQFLASVKHPGLYGMEDLL